ncbi:MAG: alcohol dehydrogenase catalytic domain-containing protein [Xanthobacteraceae bacterium]|nr:alcohol dehydrogenase catalytic domain-containing protein [Xanthobacteraceae bacterium]
MTAIRAAVSTDIRRTEVREFASPDIPVDGGLLRVELCGVCGSDWPYYLKYPKSKGPLILGHETVGTVAKLGRVAAQRFGVKEGDRVALEEYLPCGHCDYCRGGDFRLCDATDTLNKPGTVRYGSTPISQAPSLWGGYSQHQYLHPNSVFHRVPDRLSSTLATLALPLGNGVEWAYLQGKVGVGEAIVIQGPGQQGLACVVAAREAGAKAIIVTGLGTPTDQKRLALAKRLGAHHTIDVEAQDLIKTVADITGGAMADVVIDCASGGPWTVVSAIQLARKGGRILIGGRKGAPVPQFDVDILFTRFLSVKGMRGHSYQAVELGLQILASGKYPLEEMCTHTFALDAVDEALRTVGGEGQGDAIHCAVDPWR